MRAIDCAVLALQVYMDNSNDTKIGHAHDFAPLCSIVGRLAPRLADSVWAVRKSALRAVYLAFRQSLIYGGHSRLETDILDAALFDEASFAATHLGSEGRLDHQQSRDAILAIAKV